MALLHTPEAELGWKAGDFALKGTDGKTYALADVKGARGLVVIFICNHCPYVKAIIDKIVRDMRDLKSLGVGSIAINANDPAEYPEDSFENMKKLAAAKRFPFPYVMDETQGTAKAYGAVCTPDFYGFDANLALQYRGRLDDAGKESKPGSRRDLFEAMQSLAEAGKVPAKQLPSMGCSIKWR